MRKLKILGMFLMMVLSSASFTSCSDDDDDEEENSELATMIVGKWRITEVEQEDGSMFDVTTAVGESVFEPTFATFRSDGTYYGYGYFGIGFGTYKVRGDKIYTYVGGEDYIIYTVESYTAKRATLVMSMEGSSSTIRVTVEKQ